MHIHLERPGCYLIAGEPPERAPTFREGGKWCYTTIEEATTHTPGCFGCKRFKAERDAEQC